jgi:proton-translocating NADH-quinone oxidoreductase chain N
MNAVMFYCFIPEIFFVFCILLHIVFNVVIFRYRRLYNYSLFKKEIYSQVFFILFCLLCLLLNSKIEGFFFNYLFLNDESTKLIKIVSVLIVIFSLPSIFLSFNIQKINFFEFFSFLMVSLFSLMLLCSSNDLLPLYITIEIQSLCFYVMATLNRTSSFSNEAGLKYFLSGAIISGCFLFGISLLYGALGTLNLTFLHVLFSSSIYSYSTSLYYVVVIGVVSVFSLLLFKLVCAPFHFWSPDVYEGSPLSSTIVFSVVSKVPLFYTLIK